MEIRLNIITVFVIVAVAAVVGMALGGIVGYLAGRASPDLWRHMLAWTVLERPVETAILVCAGVGAAFGAGLGVFAVIVQLVVSAIAKRKGSQHQQID